MNVNKSIKLLTIHKSKSKNITEFNVSALVWMGFFYTKNDSYDNLNIRNFFLLYSVDLSVEWLCVCWTLSMWYFRIVHCITNLNDTNCLRVENNCIHINMTMANSVLFGFFACFSLKSDYSIYQWNIGLKYTYCYKCWCSRSCLSTEIERKRARERNKSRN